MSRAETVLNLFEVMKTVKRLPDDEIVSGDSQYLDFFAGLSKFRVGWDPATGRGAIQLDDMGDAFFNLSGNDTSIRIGVNDERTSTIEFATAAAALAYVNALKKALDIAKRGAV